MIAISALQDRAHSFEENRGRIWRVAYRMLGSRAEADDVVQDAYLRWHHALVEEIRAPQAWLVTTVTRIAIDRLRQLRAERDFYTGPWLPDPIVTEAPPADSAAEMASELSVAFMAVLERLAPEERAAFLLHDVFDADYGDIANTLGKTETACRQIVSRARKRVRAARPRVRANADVSARLLDRFVDALQTHDRNAMLQLLAREATWTADGGGHARAALKVVRGADRVARFAVGVFRKFVHAMEFRRVVVNGEPGLAVLFGGHLFSIMAIRTEGDCILDVCSVLNPQKLEGVRIPLHRQTSE
jgi:RNA polymerase sigma-70 factor (ECF subfamily)